jgi:uncharacterized membrane protein YbhN (UPF0104 family)
VSGRKIAALDDVKGPGVPPPFSFPVARNGGEDTESPDVAVPAGAMQGAGLQPSRAFAIKLAAGIALLGLLLWHYDLRSAFGLIEQERAEFFASAVALFVAGQIMSAFRWQLLARLNGIEGRFREYLAYYFIGMFTNVFVPGLIGGDALRAVYLGRRYRKFGEALASVVADRGIGLLALAWLAAAAALCVTAVKLPRSVTCVIFTTGLISLLGYLALAPAATLLMRFGRGFARRLAPLISYMRRPRELIPAILLSIVLQLSLATCQYLLALGLSLPIQLSTFVLIVPIANVVASLPVTINGLGMREAAYLVLLGMAGIAKDQAVALSLLYFAATMVGGMTGVVPFIVTRMPR